MDIGLVGLPRSGKTTVFNLLTHQRAETTQFGGRAELRRALAPVPDARLDVLAAMFSPRKTTPAQLTVVDVPGLSRGDHGGPNRFFQDVRAVDALIHVVRGFDSALDGSAAPLKDIEDLELELSLADLDLVEKRRQRISSGKKVTKEAQAELALLDQLYEALDSGQRLDQVPLSEDARRLFSGYQFLTLKPMVWVVNLDEDRFRSESFPDGAEVRALAESKGVPVVLLAGSLEQEIEELADGDRAEFMRDLGIEETGIARVARAIYQHLGFISFLTAGDDEVRAWPIREGTTAKQAAGKIHSDIERGFIRAEVVAFDALQAAGSMAKAREQGLVRLEGKDYIMRDGDVVNFRFNV